MQKYPLIGKCLAVGMILLFIGVAIAPSINFHVVKASNDNDLFEVTSQACGLNGFGNTTVKLTRQQYQNLEQYLVDFRARLNQTTTKEEAVPIFKDAVVELNKYGLLPKGMSIEKAQKFISGPQLSSNQIEHLKGLLNNNRMERLSNASNLFCFLTATNGRNDGQVNLNPTTLVGLLIGIVGAGLMMIGTTPVGYNFGPFVWIGAPLFILGILMFGYSWVKPFIPLNILVSITNANYSSFGLLGKKQGFIPYLALIGFAGIEILSKSGWFHMGWAVATTEYHLNP
jgi:hypothetical protein